MFRSQPFQQAIAKPKPLGPETSNWYWNPNRVGAYEAPFDYMAKVKEIDPDKLISINWNPVTERWQVWYRKPSFQHKICSGWVLLFPVVHGDGSFMPLDERTLARLYGASARKWGDGKKYWDALEREFVRDAEKKEERLRSEAIDQAMPYYEHSQIKNIGRGSKFSEYHA